jgi:hypothetical protein
MTGVEGAGMSNVLFKSTTPAAVLTWTLTELVPTASTTQFQFELELELVPEAEKLLHPLAVMLKLESKDEPAIVN